MKSSNKNREFVIRQAKLQALAEAHTGTFKNIADAMLNPVWSLTQEYIMAHSFELEIHKHDDHIS